MESAESARQRARAAQQRSFCCRLSGEQAHSGAATSPGHDAHCEWSRADAIRSKRKFIGEQLSRSQLSYFPGNGPANHSRQREIRGNEFLVRRPSQHGGGKQRTQARHKSNTKCGGSDSSGTHIWAAGRRAIGRIRSLREQQPKLPGSGTRQAPARPFAVYSDADRGC